MNDCIFCKIVKGEIPSKKIYENDKIYAFLDISPASPGHSLVIPKKHFKDIHDIPTTELCEVIKGVQKIASVVVRALGADGVNVLQANGKASGQSVFHLHFHIIPRFNGDKLDFLNWKGKKEIDEKIFKKIKKEF